MSKLPLEHESVLLYECANSDCFYDGVLVDFFDVKWKDVWNSTLQDVEPIPICPSCEEPVMVWNGVDE